MFELVKIEEVWLSKGFGVFHPLAFAAYEEGDLAKGRTHKYIKREPYTNAAGKKKYRYWYRMPGKEGLVSQSSLKVGSSFRHGAGDEAGHFHITAVNGDKVTVTHDETGKTVTTNLATLKTLLEHGKHDLGETAKQRGSRKLNAYKNAVKFGSEKQKADRLADLQQHIQAYNDTDTDSALKTYEKQQDKAAKDAQAKAAKKAAAEKKAAEEKAAKDAEASKKASENKAAEDKAKQEAEASQKAAPAFEPNHKVFGSFTHEKVTKILGFLRANMYVGTSAAWQALPSGIEREEVSTVQKCIDLWTNGNYQTVRNPELFDPGLAEKMRGRFFQFTPKKGDFENAHRFMQWAVNQPLGQEKKLYRGLVLTPSEAFSLLQEGKDFDLRVASSFSEDEQVSSTFSRPERGEIGVKLIVKTRTGFDINKLSCYTSEKETALGNKMKILSVKEDNRYGVPPRYLIVELEHTPAN